MKVKTREYHHLNTAKNVNVCLEPEDNFIWAELKHDVLSLINDNDKGIETVGVVITNRYWYLYCHCYLLQVSVVT